MQAKNVLYAAVGAPVVAARKVTGAVGDLRSRITSETSDYTKVAERAIDGWAVEGEKLVTRVADNKTVEELSARVDLDQAREQVGKLRTQLEDMLATWRSSFRPEKVEMTITATPPAPKVATATKPAAKKPAAKATAVKKPAAKKPAAKATAAKSTTAKTSSTKTGASKAAKA